MGYSSVMPPKPKRYYARHRKMVARKDGVTVEVEALVTRYTYATGIRPEKGPRGGKAGREFFRQVLYYDGTFYKILSEKQEHDSGWLRFLEPINGVIWDCHQLQSEEQGIPVVAFQLKDGKPTQLSYYGQWMPIDGMDPCLEDDLSLNKRKRRSPRVTRK